MNSEKLMTFEEWCKKHHWIAYSSYEGGGCANYSAYILYNAYMVNWLNARVEGRAYRHATELVNKMTQKTAAQFVRELIEVMDWGYAANDYKAMTMVMSVAMQQARDEALDEAALVAVNSQEYNCGNIATAIRALKETK